MKQTGSRFSFMRTHWLALGVAAMFVTRAQDVTAQTFGDFETGLDGFFGSDNSLRTNQTIVATNVVVNQSSTL